MGMQVLLSNLFCAYGEGSAMESISLCAAMVMPVLVMKSHACSKPKEHLICLQRRLVDWKEGNINGPVS